ncbi:MAG: hypothetical protein AAGK47_02940, partial [Bacteroidota bacterium]
MQLTSLHRQKEMKKVFSSVCYSLLALSLWAQSSPIVTTAADASNDPDTYAKTITAEDLRRHLTVLASDEYEGRETGTTGQQKAAVYIEEHFKSLGLPAVVAGTYQQKIAFTAENWQRLELTVGERAYQNMVNFYAFPTTNTNLDITQDEVLFLGYGIDDPMYSDYKDVIVRDKVLLIYGGEPVNKKGISYLTGTTALSDWSTNWRKKMRI